MQRGPYAHKKDIAELWHYLSADCAVCNWLRHVFSLWALILHHAVLVVTIIAANAVRSLENNKG